MNNVLVWHTHTIDVVGVGVWFLEAVADPKGGGGGDLPPFFFRKTNGTHHFYPGLEPPFFENGWIHPWIED